MVTNTSLKIIEYIKKNQKARPHDLIRKFNFSAMAIHKQLRRLIDKKILEKIGKPPLVYYVLKNKYLPKNIFVPKKIINKINKNYLYISPRGEILKGFIGFSQWVKDIKQENSLNSLAIEYLKTRQSANKFITPNKWIDATNRLKTTFKESYIDKLIYQDFYSLPKFGKTKLGQFVLHAKQSQNKKIIKLIVKETKPLIEKIIKTYNIEAVVFIPPTIPRNIQFIKEFEAELNIKLPKINLTKVYRGDVIVAQKTLSRLEERVVNAQETIYLKENEPIKPFIKNILLIDDAVGSGSTFNETAKKIKQTGFANMIIAFAIVGSYKGFDVIREI